MGEGRGEGRRDGFTKRDDVRFACLVERAWLLRRAREAGFLAIPAHWSVAVQALRSRAEAWRPIAAADPAIAARLAAFDADVASLEALAENA